MLKPLPTATTTDEEWLALLALADTLPSEGEVEEPPVDDEADLAYGRAEREDALLRKELGW